MDPLENDLRRILRDDRWRLTPRGDASATIRHGVARRGRRRTVAAVFVAVLVVVGGTTGAIAAVRINNNGAGDNLPLAPAPTPSTSPTLSPAPQEPKPTSPPSPVAASQPASGSTGDEAIDTTWTSPERGWALVGKQCGHDPVRCAAVYGTTDGGKTWQLRGRPSSYVTPEETPPGIDCYSDRGCISHVWFKDDNVGYLFSPMMYMTNDGGRTWTQVQGRHVESLLGSGGFVYRLTFTHGGCPGPCNTQLERARPDSTHWVTVKSWPEPHGGFGGELFSGGTNLYAVFYGHIAGGVESHADLWISHDGGDNWTQRADPCGTYQGHEEDTVTAAAVGDYLAALCIPKDGQTTTFVTLSPDGGRSFAPLTVVPLKGLERLALVNGNTLAAGGWAASRLAVSTDSGRTWHLTSSAGLQHGPEGFSGDLEFRSPTAIVWISEPHQIRTSDDLGRTWRSQPAP